MAEYFISQLNQEIEITVSGEALDSLSTAADGTGRDVDVLLTSTAAGTAALFNDIFAVYSDSSYNINGGSITSTADISYSSNADANITALNTLLSTTGNIPAIENFQVSAAAASAFADDRGPEDPDGLVDGSGCDQSDASKPFSNQVPEDYLANLAYRLTNLAGAGEIISNKNEVLENVNDKFIEAFVAALGSGFYASNNGQSSSYNLTVSQDDDISGNTNALSVGGATGEHFDSLIAKELLAQWFDKGTTDLNEDSASGGRVKMNGFFAANDSISFLIQLNMPPQQLELVNGQADGRRTTRVYKVKVVLT